MKSEQDVIADFNEIVNMTADELETYLKTEGSETTGFTKEDGSGESIGHESGRKIVDILTRNPDQDPSKYTEEDVEHMRRVVSYCKRHLAQEGKLKETKTPEELEKTKSTRSLKNWGHDPMKTLSKSEQPKKPASKKTEKPASKKAEKPASKKTEKPVSKKTEKPASTTKADKPVSKKSENPVSEKTDKPVSKEDAKPKSAKPASKKSEPKKTTEEADAGDKREAESQKVEKTEKPTSKKAKTPKEPTEGTRKPPSRGAKKA
ncbi:uncharacterized protein IL334_004361 [Kwoniella shivajii]|uniref:Hypervirulence associated protein TUDOR domain-containing protein n=1 Tax=Kwoniella shivajii TaxID=564305 RepID=A0ABZ1D036_9TREE|nr:hypothetical protein IL334_004361 [Kwoniella shivajii]